MEAENQLPKEEIEQQGHQIPLGFQPRIDYIKIIDKLSFLLMKMAEV